MRPRPFGRGNGGVLPSAGERHLNLQCGHDLSAVETMGPDGALMAYAYLQSGHDLSAVETGGCCRPPASAT